VQPAPNNDKPAQERNETQQQSNGAKAAEQQADNGSTMNLVQKLSAVPDKVATTSKPAETAASAAATSPAQPQKLMGIAAEHQQAARFLVDYGMAHTRVASALERMPQLGMIRPAKLQARLDALAAALGGKLSRRRFVQRVNKQLRVLTLTPSAIAARHTRLADFGLTADDAAKAFAAQPTLLVINTRSLRSNVSSLQTRYQLTPAQLRDVFIHAPSFMLRSHASAQPNDPYVHGQIRSIIASASSNTSSERSRAGKVGQTSFQ
jgi:mTERF